MSADWNTTAHTGPASPTSLGYVPLTWENAPFANMHIVPYLLMAYLTRRPNTYTIRLLLLPLAIMAIVHCTVRYQFEDPVFGMYNWLRGLVACAAMAKTIHFAVVPEGTLKVGEERLSKPHSATRINSTDKTVASKGGLTSFLPRCVYDALEVGTAARGLGWQFGRGVYVPAARRSPERTLYLKQTALSILKNAFLVDLYDTTLGALPGMTVNSGTIFYSSLHPVPRYALSTVLHVSTGVMVIIGMELWYDVASLVGVGLLGQSPTQWPPIHDNPFSLTSVHQYWAKLWHQLLRDTFLVWGGYPGRWIAGDFGMLFGTFLASGLFHEVGFYLGGSQMDARVIVFFMIQAVAILVEKVYKSVTGRRVGGWLGTVWASAVIFGLGQICSESWIARGAGGRAMVPPDLSFGRKLLLPALRAALKFLEFAR